MRFRKIALALLACMALAAVAANAAQADWTIGAEGTEPGTALTGKETVEINKHPGSTLALSSSLLGAEITLTAEDVHCASGATCTIDGTDQGLGNNHSTGTLEFTGVTVDLEGEPSNCTVSGGGAGTMVLEPLTDEVIMDPSNEAGPVFDKFFPESGTTFVTISLEGEKCALAGIQAPLKGHFVGEVVDEAGEPVGTGHLLEVQTLRFGKAAQNTGGGSLSLGKAAAYLEGEVDNTLSGKDAGKAFGADG